MKRVLFLKNSSTRRKPPGILVWALMAIPMGEQVATLPQGRFMVSMMSLLGGVSQRFDQNGSRSEIVDQFNRTITFENIATEEPARASQIKGLLQSQGVQTSQSAGNYVGKFEGRMQAFVPLVGYGITDHWGVFFTLPVIKLRTQFATAFQASPTFEQVSKEWVNTDQAALANNIYTALQNGFQQKVTSSGYRYEPNSERTVVGDLQIVSPHIFTERGERFQWGFVHQVSAPTGPTAQLDDLYGIGIGSGRWSVGTAVAASYGMGSRLTFAGSLGGALALPARLPQRIPLNEDDQLPTEADAQTKVSTTPSLKAGIESRFRLSRSWSARAGYQYQLLANASFSGNSFSPERYALLASRSGQTLHTFNAGIELNSIQAFLDRDFYFPTQLGLAAAIPLAGKNTLANTSWLVSAALFF